MDRTRLWPDFREAWIVEEDEALIFVDKPVGVPSQAPDPAWPDDVVTRLRRHLAARHGVTESDIYLGVHQRLDRDTSGLLVFTRQREANPGLARQIEGRRLVKEYVAAVKGWRGSGQVTLRDRIARGKGGRMEVVSPHDRRGRDAVTRVRVLERAGDRALVSVRIETGRTHQIRVQLAHGGAPVAGDGLFGGPPAARLMLHACALELEHPRTGTAVHVRAPVPRELHDWLAGTDRAGLDDRCALQRALWRAAERRWGLARAVEAPQPTTTFRLLHGEGDGVPGVDADVYGDFLVTHLYRDGPADPLLEALDELGFDGIYLKRHPRRANEVGARGQRDLAPPEPVRGAAAPAELRVYEHGLLLHVGLGEGLSTGLFLDQRDNRRRVRELSDGAAVLNLFAYTCAFTAAAASGGARRTVSIDASATALERGKRNVAEAGGSGDHRFVHADAFEALESLAQGGERFDLVIVDPPTYSTTRRSRWKSGTGWRTLAAGAMRCVAPGGRLLACSNDRRLRGDKLRRYLHEAAREAGRGVAQMKSLPVPADFPSPPGREPHLKSILVTLT